MDEELDHLLEGMAAANKQIQELRANISHIADRLQKTSPIFTLAVAILRSANHPLHLTMDLLDDANDMVLRIRPEAEK